MLREDKKSRNSLSLLLISIYQVWLSPFFGGNCRFHPSCSCYAREAYENYGWASATYLSLRRLLKCHPFGPRGYDPLPLKESP